MKKLLLAIALLLFSSLAQAKYVPVLITNAAANSLAAWSMYQISNLGYAGNSGLILINARANSQSAVSKWDLKMCMIAASTAVIPTYLPPANTPYITIPNASQPFYIPADNRMVVSSLGAANNSTYIYYALTCTASAIDVPTVELTLFKEVK